MARLAKKGQKASDDRTIDFEVSAHAVADALRSYAHLAGHEHVAGSPRSRALLGLWDVRLA